jgi:hypothetical protein
MLDMLVIPPVLANLQEPGFWQFNAKDIITAIIALAALLTSLTNVWVAYLRRHKLRCDLADVLRIGYGPRPNHYLMFKIEVFAMNTGARPGVITRMAVQLTGHHSQTMLYWTEVTRTENIAPKGEPRKIWTDFAGFASPVLIPKYDSRLIEAAFWADRTADLAVGHAYRFKLMFWVAGREKAYSGGQRMFKLTPIEHDFLERVATSDARGFRARHLTLASVDGKEFKSPVSTAHMIESYRNFLPDEAPLDQQIPTPAANKEPQ